ncbi:MAG: hypothetical protein HY290_03970 [Planctomycetia bacterium]|nr:hypothetical protein [Planctomycetia bacterium]
MTTTRQNQVTEKAIHATLDSLGFATINPRNDCRDHAASAIRVHLITDDERCSIYAFAGKLGQLLRYEISLPYAAPIEVIRAAIVAAVGIDRVSTLVAAARRLLEAREDQMVTSEEWDRLREAVDATQA